MSLEYTEEGYSTSKDKTKEKHWDWWCKTSGVIKDEGGGQCGGI